MPNHQKFLFWNLCQPMHKKISWTDMQDKIRLTLSRIRVARLQAEIARELEPKRADARRLHEMDDKFKK